MKKGDTVQQFNKTPPGTALNHNFNTDEDVRNSMRGNPIPYTISPDPLNEGKLSAISNQDFIEEVTGVVNWVVGEEASITTPDGIILTKDLINWTVVKESSTPSLTAREQAEGMSVEELRASIERLRGMRAKAPAKSAGGKGQREGGSPSDSLALALSKLTPEQKERIKAKIGLKL